MTDDSILIDSLINTLRQIRNAADDGEDPTRPFLLGFMTAAASMLDVALESALTNDEDDMHETLAQLQVEMDILLMFRPQALADALDDGLPAVSRYINGAINANPRLKESLEAVFSENFSEAIH